MPLPQRDQASVYVRKATELALRTATIAPDFRAARRLRAQRGHADPRIGDGRRVLMLSPRDWVEHVQNQAMIGHALRARGADVEFATCGGGLEICDRANVYEAPPMPCRSCRHYTEHALAAHGFPVTELTPLVQHADPVWPELDSLPVDALHHVSYRDLPLGDLVDIPVKWFLCAADVDDDPLAGHVTRAFLRSARRLADSTALLIEQRRPDLVVMLSGLFLFESIARAICEQRGIDVVTYERAFLKDTLVFSRDEPAGRYDFSALYAQDRRELRVEEGAELDSYLERRRAGRAFDQYWDFTTSNVSNGVGRTAVLFTNLTWDTAVIGRDRAFPGIRQWIDSAIELFERRPSDRLVVRVHPSEVHLPGKGTRDSLGAYIAQRWEELPRNVEVVPAADPQSSYELMSAADLGLVYTSTTGLEMALMGTPVVVAGETHYRNKGFTVDVEDVDDFNHAVTGLLEDPSIGPVDVAAARQYAHFFFFRAPVATAGVVEPLPGLARITVRDLRELEQGSNPELDRLCDLVMGPATVGRTPPSGEPDRSAPLEQPPRHVVPPRVAGEEP